MERDGALSESDPSICIAYSKMYVGAGDDIPMTEAFIRSAFSRYGDIANVVMIPHFTAGLPRRRTEDYYRVIIHFNRWNVENGEARYVRSVLMSNSPNANIKLSYSGPWYWKFSANR